MEFLNKLYESEYFIYIIGGTIAVLLILFLVILLSGRKKKGKKEEVTEEIANKSIIEDTTPVVLDTATSVETLNPSENLDETKEFKVEDLTDMSDAVAAVPTTEEVLTTPISEESVPAFTPEPSAPESLEVKLEEPSEPVLNPQMNVPTSTMFDVTPSVGPLDIPAVPEEPKVESFETLNPSKVVQPAPSKISFTVNNDELPKLNTENKE